MSYFRVPKELYLSYEIKIIRCQEFFLHVIVLKMQENIRVSRKVYSILCIARYNNYYRTVQVWFLQLKLLKCASLKTLEFDSPSNLLCISDISLAHMPFKNFTCKFYTLFKEKIWYRKKSIIETLYRIFILHDVC